MRDKRLATAKWPIFRRIVALYLLSKSAGSELNQPRKEYELREFCVHHSVTTSGIQLSMAEVGQAEQNGYAERVIRTSKEEEVHEELSGCPAACGGEEAVHISWVSKGAQRPLVKGGVNAPPAKPRRAACVFAAAEFYLTEYRDFEEALAQIGHFIAEVYLTKRIHSALGYLTPAEFEAQWQTKQAASIL